MYAKYTLEQLVTRRDEIKALMNKKTAEFEEKAEWRQICREIAHRGLK
jgi:DNA polymerase elongation subunit (family B)